MASFQIVAEAGVASSNEEEDTDGYLRKQDGRKRNIILLAVGTVGVIAVIALAVGLTHHSSAKQTEVLQLFADMQESSLLPNGSAASPAPTQEEQGKEKEPEPCLCLFDVDRTLTGQQGLTGPTCPRNQVKDNKPDTAYGGGDLTLSEAGLSLADTFCIRRGCYLGIITAGDCSGPGSPERNELVKRLQLSGGKIPSTEWCGPSKFGEARRACTPADATSTLMTGCVDGTKQEGAKGILTWLLTTEGVTISNANVWHFDDRDNNISPFEGTGFNAREVSCATRDQKYGTGLCGAVESEILDEPGVRLCSSAVVY